MPRSEHQGLVGAATSRGPLTILTAFSVLVVLAVVFLVERDRRGTDTEKVGAHDRTMLVHKTPWCGCCGEWAAYADEAGFDVRVVEHADLAPVRRRLGVPDDLASCHTAEVGGYVIEGHVPAPDIERLLSERPDGIGLALPGMVPNSPGMEVPDGPRPTYRTILFDGAGNRSVFAIHGSEGTP